MSVMFLKENLYKTDILAILMICLGSLLFLRIAKNNGTEYTEKELIELYLSPLSIVFILVSAMWIVFVYKYDS
jgi:hypothetical protein